MLQRGMDGEFSVVKGYSLGRQAHAKSGEGFGLEYSKTEGYSWEKMRAVVGAETGV